MRVVFRNNLSVVIYGLVAITYTFPSSPIWHIAHSLNRRALIGPTKQTIHPVEPPVTHPAEPLVNPSHSPGGAKPGTENTPEPAPLAATPKDTPTKGAENIAALQAKLGEKSPSSNDFSDYIAKIKRYTVFSKKTFAGFDDVTINIFGFKGATLDLPHKIPPVWRGTVDPSKGIMNRLSEVYKGTVRGVDAETYYKNIPLSERIHTHEHIAKAWNDHGGGKPMKEHNVLTIDDDEMVAYLKKLYAEKGNKDFIITPLDTEAWKWIMGGSIGSPLSIALTRHPALFHYYMPLRVKIEKGGALDVFDAFFKLGPSRGFGRSWSNFWSNFRFGRNPATANANSQPTNFK